MFVCVVYSMVAAHSAHVEIFSRIKKTFSIYLHSLYSVESIKPRGGSGVAQSQR